MTNPFAPVVPIVDWLMASPVIVVCGTGVLALIVEMLRPKKTNNLIVLISLLGLVAAFGLLLAQVSLPPGETFGVMIVRDPLAIALQLALVGVCFLSILLSEGYLREKRISFGEFYPLILWSTAGAMIMVATTNLLMIFLGLEVLSIALYVMAGLSRQEQRSEESALKYFLLGAFASGFLLYGIAFLYGATGSLELAALAEVWPLANLATKGMIVFGVGLLLIGLSFKSAFVPFHQWTPDVYQGAPTNVTAFMAAGSKIAAIGVLARVLDGALPLRDVWLPALVWLAVLTMTVGNLVACVQTDLKRTLGYSSVAHAGYLLVGLLAHLMMPEEIGLGTTVFYLIAYSLMTIGAFAVIALTASKGGESTAFSALNGLWQRSPISAILLIVFMASLIGVPPTAGFFGKLLIFQDALKSGLAPLAIVLAVNSVISAYYYVGIARAAFVSEEGVPEGRVAKVNPGLALAYLICGVGTLVISGFIHPILALVGG